MKPTVYLETTVISHLTARPSRDPVAMARQTITREWWHVRRESFDLVISDLVLQEMRSGDPDAARRYDLESIIARGGYPCPAICTPEELMEPVL